MSIYIMNFTEIPERHKKAPAPLGYTFSCKSWLNFIWLILWFENQIKPNKTLKNGHDLFIYTSVPFHFEDRLWVQLPLFSPFVGEHEQLLHMPKGKKTHREPPTGEIKSNKNKVKAEL